MRTYADAVRYGTGWEYFYPGANRWSKVSHPMDFSQNTERSNNVALPLIKRTDRAASPVGVVQAATGLSHTKWPTLGASNSSVK
jgi:hypothetical protein